MKPSTLLPILPLFLLLLLSGRPSLASEALRSMCNFLGGDYISYDYCFATLSSNPASSTADCHTLAVIATNLTAANATAVRSLAVSLSNSASYDPFVRASLRNCSSLYAAATLDLRRSASATASRDYSSAANELTAVLHIPTVCDEAFVGGDGAAEASPISKENGAFSNLVMLAKAVNNYMAHQ